MGRAPCCDKANVKKGPWSPEEDAKLKEYMEKHGTGGNWIALPQKAGLRRCGKSCRLRWLNYLRPNIKHGEFSDEEDRIICSLYASIGSRWSIIASQLPGRTDNDIKNYWNTKLKKKLMGLVSPSNEKTRTHHHHHQLMAQYPQNVSLFQTSLSPSMVTSSPYSSPSISSTPFKCTNYFSAAATQTPIFQDFQSALSIPPTQSAYVGASTIQNHHHQMVNMRDRVLNFGGDQAQASCSSTSDGSNNNQLLRHNNEQVVDYDYGTENLGGFQQSFVYDNNNNNSGYDVATTDVKPNVNVVVENGCYGGTGDNNGNPPLDYNSLEEIKQLISTSNMCNSLNNFFVDEIKTEEKVLTYY